MLDFSPQIRDMPPIALGPDAGEELWCLGFLTEIKASSEMTGGRVAVIEQLGPLGTGWPLHVHRNEDEWFYVLEGKLTFWIGGRVFDAPAGSFVYAPRDVAHTLLVSSEHARFLLGVEPGGFDGFVSALAEPAQGLEIPPAAPPQVACLTSLAAEYGVEILGPPGIPA